MSLTIHESFRVNVPPARAWDFLIDPTRVVTCLPGAELTETVDTRTYRGRVKVKVGPVSTAYDGTATLTEVNEAAHVMRMTGEGREMGAAGSARMKMVATISAHSEGGSLIEVDATIDIAGRVMQFGRGLVESVSRQLFKQFSDAVRETLEGEASHEPVAIPDAAPASSPREMRLLPLVWHAVVELLKRPFRAT